MGHDSRPELVVTTFGSGDGDLKAAIGDVVSCYGAVMIPAACCEGSKRVLLTGQMEKIVASGTSGTRLSEYEFAKNTLLFPCSTYVRTMSFDLPS
jgi:hypothetical protein